MVRSRTHMMVAGYSWNWSHGRCIVHACVELYSFCLVNLPCVDLVLLDVWWAHCMHESDHMLAKENRLPTG